eukprot:6391239-Prorocentrum_lima.AAC.1
MKYSFVIWYLPLRGVGQQGGCAVLTTVRRDVSPNSLGCCGSTTAPCGHGSFYSFYIRASSLLPAAVAPL